MNFVDLVGDCFLTDDGSLPDLELGGLNGREVEALYEFLTSKSRISKVEPTFWDTVERRDVPVESVPNAAALVVSRRAEGFHVCLEGLHIGNTELPELGVAVFQDSLELDYRMGPKWTEETIHAFFELLFQLTLLAPAVTLADGGEGLPNPTAFLQTWESYRISRASQRSANAEGDP